MHTVSSTNRLYRGCIRVIKSADAGQELTLCNTYVHYLFVLKTELEERADLISAFPLWAK